MAFRTNRRQSKFRLCRCGCGGEVTSRRRGRLGDPAYINGHQSKRGAADRFWASVDKSNLDGCWPWLGCRTPAGYGQVTVDGRQIGAHRASWRLTHGEIPAGLYVLHSCDNPSCVRPDHLRVGTPRENAADCISRGRYRGIAYLLGYRVCDGACA